MALLGSHSVLNKTPGRWLGGSSTAGAYVAGTRPNFTNRSSSVARFASDASYLDQSPVPDGYRPPYCWVMPLKAGSIAAHTYGLNGSGTVSSVNLAGGKYLTADLTGLGTISSADIGLIVSIVAALSGTGTLTLSPDMVGVLQASAALSGSGTLTADVGALAGMAAALTGTGTAAADFTAKGNISADILPYTDLSPQALAQAVWDEPTADHTDAGSFGAFVQKLLTVAKFLGLK